MLTNPPFQRQPYLPAITAHTEGQVRFEELEKVVQVIVKLPVREVEDESHRYQVEYVLFVMLAPFGEVAQQIFLVRQLAVKLKVVQHLLKHLALHAVLVSVAPVGLLPSEVYEHVLRILVLDPVGSVTQHPPNDCSVVAGSDIVLRLSEGYFVLLLAYYLRHLRCLQFSGLALSCLSHDGSYAKIPSLGQFYGTPANVLGQDIILNWFAEVPCASYH